MIQFHARGLMMLGCSIWQWVHPAINKLHGTRYCCQLTGKTSHICCLRQSYLTHLWYAKLPVFFTTRMEWWLLSLFKKTPRQTGKKPPKSIGGDNIIRFLGSRKYLGVAARCEAFSDAGKRMKTPCDAAKLALWILHFKPALLDRFPVHRKTYYMAVFLRGIDLISAD